MTDLLWSLIALQMAMGAFDTLYHHEGIERLAWRPSQRTELRLHGVRNLLYFLLFAAIGWSEPGGAAAAALTALLTVELAITLWDFVEEDRTRSLPASERVTHALLTLNYGAILAFAGPMLAGWMARETGLAPAWHGLWSWLCTAAAAGTLLWGVRDLAAAARAGRLNEADPAPLAARLAPGLSILVTGGTGFIGRRLIAALTSTGHQVTLLTRDPARAAGLPAPLTIVTDLDQIPASARIDAIVNLAGEPIAGGPWTPARRGRILHSRLDITWRVGRLIERLETPPLVLVSGSAIGWYGLRGSEALTESADYRECFTHLVCAAWEAAAAKAAGRSVRLVILRTGLVLGRDGGLLARMLAPFEFGLGGRFGDGRQAMSWIHRDDLVRLIALAIADEALAGPLNATAPAPVSNAAFAATLGKTLRRPTLLPVPAAPLRLALGAFADELLLGGQAVLPARAIERGFRFAYPDLRSALDEIVGARAVPKAREPLPRRTRRRPASSPLL